MKRIEILNDDELSTIEEDVEKYDVLMRTKEEQSLSTVHEPPAAFWVNHVRRLLDTLDVYRTSAGMSLTDYGVDNARKRAQTVIEREQAREPMERNRDAFELAQDVSNLVATIKHPREFDFEAHYRDASKPFALSDYSDADIDALRDKFETYAESEMKTQIHALNYERLALVARNLIFTLDSRSKSLKELREIRDEAMKLVKVIVKKTDGFNLLEELRRITNSNTLKDVDILSEKAQLNKTIVENVKTALAKAGTVYTDEHNVIASVFRLVDDFIEHRDWINASVKLISQNLDACDTVVAGKTVPEAIEKLISQIRRERASVEALKERVTSDAAWFERAFKRVEEAGIMLLADDVFENAFERLLSKLKNQAEELRRLQEREANKTLSDFRKMLQNRLLDCGHRDAHSIKDDELLSTANAVLRDFADVRAKIVEFMNRGRDVNIFDGLREMLAKLYDYHQTRKHFDRKQMPLDDGAADETLESLVLRMRDKWNEREFAFSETSRVVRETLGKLRDIGFEKCVTAEEAFDEALREIKRLRTMRDSIREALSAKENENVVDAVRRNLDEVRRAVEYAESVRLLEKQARETAEALLCTYANQLKRVFMKEPKNVRLDEIGREFDAITAQVAEIYAAHEESGTIVSEIRRALEDAKFHPGSGRNLIRDVISLAHVYNVKQEELKEVQQRASKYWSLARASTLELSRIAEVLSIGHLVVDDTTIDIAEMKLVENVRWHVWEVKRRAEIVHAADVVINEVAMLFSAQVQVDEQIVKTWHDLKISEQIAEQSRTIQSLREQLANDHWMKVALEIERYFDDFTDASSDEEAGRGLSLDERVKKIVDSILEDTEAGANCWAKLIGCGRFEIFDELNRVRTYLTQIDAQGESIYDAIRDIVKRLQAERDEARNERDEITAGRVGSERRVSHLLAENFLRELEPFSSYLDNEVTTLTVSVGALRKTNRIVKEFFERAEMLKNGKRPVELFLKKGHNSDGQS
jgi:hypothetical protein